jgi:integrase
VRQVDRLAGGIANTFVPEVYEDDEVALLLGGCDQRHRAAYSVMLKALFREKECVYLTWADVDAKRSVLRVRSKPEYGWRVKKYHERDVTVPRDLIVQIMALPRTGVLVFGREDGKPDLHMLRYLKQVAGHHRPRRGSVVQFFCSSLRASRLDSLPKCLPLFAVRQAVPYFTDFHCGWFAALDLGAVGFLEPTVALAAD